jgi:uncharacterized protein YndB with AHSA1/START domain
VCSVALRPPDEIHGAEDERDRGGAGMHGYEPRHGNILAQIRCLRRSIGYVVDVSQGGIMTGLVATAAVEIDAEPEQVWQALIDPNRIKEYSFGADVVSDFRPGSPITWSGEYNGNAFQDKGTIIEAEPRRRLSMSHFSPLSGLPDVPENYHTVTYELTELRHGTRVTLRQDNNATPEDVAHSTKNWTTVLDGLKKVTEATS